METSVPPDPQHGSADLAVAREVLGVEARALEALAAGLDQRFSDIVGMILNARGRVVCTGVGKSGHVAHKIAATLSSTGTAAYYVHPTEASHGDLGLIQSSDVILALSRSGETAELDDLVHYSRRFGAGLIAVTANAASALARAADLALVLPDAPEACAETQAPTTSTTMMIALGDALAVALLRRRGFDAQQFKLFHPGGKLGALLKTAADLMRGGGATPLVASGSPLALGLDEISAKEVGCVGVVDPAGHLVGIITDGDLRRLIAAGAPPSTVDHAMTRNPVSVAPGTLAAMILQQMNARRITQVFVVDDGKPVGVVHMHDILKAGLA